MNRTRYILLLLLLSGSLNLLGQQLAQYSQYMFNDFSLNPAVAGIHDYYQIRTNHRYQWVGMEDPPITNSIAFYGPHTRMDMGFGGAIYTDVTGPTSKTSLTGSYAYNVALTSDIRLSMGLSFGILQYKIDGTRLSPEDPSDLLIQGVVDTRYAPDAGIGAYVQGSNFYAGISALQLLNNKLKVFDEQTGLNTLKTHVYITGGYRYQLNRDWVIEPTALIKMTAPSQFRFEVNAKVEWTEMVWLAAGYRFHEAAIIMAGYNYNDKFYFGYAYDIGIADIRNYNSGSHEIMIGYRFNDLK